MENPTNPLNDLFNSLVTAVIQDLKNPNTRKEAYGAAVALLKNMDFGIVVKAGTPASRLTSSLPFSKKETA